MDKSKQIWVDVGREGDIPLQGSRIVKTPNGCLALFKTMDGQIYALDDSCPHKKGPLSQGMVHDKFVTCPLHSWVFSLETGQAQGADVGQVKTTPVKVENGRVKISLSATKTVEAA